MKNDNEWKLMTRDMEDCDDVIHYLTPMKDYVPQESFLSHEDRVCSPKSGAYIDSPLSVQSLVSPHVNVIVNEKPPKRKRQTSEEDNPRSVKITTASSHGQQLGAARGAATKCIYKERQALLDFKASLEDPNGRLSTWRDEDEDCCHWRGVVCDNTLGHVTGLDLAYNNLSRTSLTVQEQIPYELTNLHGLVILDLSLNALTGEIPQDIGQMTELLTLNLSRNFFSGKMPSSMSKMDSLNDLDVSYNNMSGKVPSSTQLQSFEPARFKGNKGLCGPPVTKSCPDDEELEASPTNGESDGDGDGDDNDELWNWFYIGGGTGFATSFWIACIALFLNRDLRHAFLHLQDSLKSWVCMKMQVINLNQWHTLEKKGLRLRKAPATFLLTATCWHSISTAGTSLGSSADFGCKDFLLRGMSQQHKTRVSLEKRIEITNDGWRLRIEHVRSLALISFAGETANDGNPIDKEERRCSSTMKLRLEERGLGPGRAFRDWVGWIIELGAKDERSGPGFESNRPSLSSQGEARNSSKCSFFNISRSWISCSSDPEWILVEGQSKALQAFESKHGHLQLRGSSRSSMEEPSEEEGEGFIPPAAHVSDPKGIANERRICVHYPWSGVTILNLLFSISPFFAFGYYRLATLGPTLDLFENNTSKVAFIQSKLLCPSTNDSLWKERNAGNKSFLSTGS
ncbi:leucine-rich repeat domain, L domain-like protein [Tanacetum coccineum]